MTYSEKNKEEVFFSVSEEPVAETEHGKSAANYRLIIASLVISLILSNVIWFLNTRPEPAPANEIAVSAPLPQPDGWEDWTINQRVEWLNVLANNELSQLEVKAVTLCTVNDLACFAAYIHSNHEIVIDTASLSRAELGEAIYAVCKEAYYAYYFAVQSNACHVGDEDVEMNSKLHASFQTYQYLSFFSEGQISA